jgi:protein ImuA
MSVELATLVDTGRVWRGLLPGGGWPVGALCEIVHTRAGLGELALVLPLLARLTAANRHVALIAPPHIPYAPALVAAGLRLSGLLVVDLPELDVFWSAEQLLRTQVGAVLIWPRRADMQALRRLQLAAEDARGFVFLFHDGRLRNFSSVALRLRLQRIGGMPHAEILKCRGGAIGRRCALG